MPRVPLLFLTDSFDLNSGLARIGRDLAIRVHATLGDKFKVGALGRGGIGGVDLPFPNYVIPHDCYGSGTASEWGASVLPDVWRQFAGPDKGIIFTIWDPARMLWLSKPEYLPDGPIRRFLGRPTSPRNRPFDLWGYFPIDGHTPDGTLGRMAGEALAGYDRRLAYTKYGAQVISKVIGDGLPTEYLPHGVDAVWYPRDKARCREVLYWNTDDFVVGVVATNHIRKDWGLAAEVGKLLRERHGLKYKQWWHVDVEERYWSIPALLDEFALGPYTLVSHGQSDGWLAQAYSGCDVTLGIGNGEGMGFPLIESQLCGTPVIHGNYAGGTEVVPKDNLVDWYMRRLEGPLNVMRPCYNPLQWEAKVLELVPGQVGDCRGLYWDKLWPRWQKWFEDGLATL